MDALEVKMMKAIGEERRYHEHMKIAREPEDRNSPDANIYNTMLREASKEMDRQIEEICQMEHENEGNTGESHKAKSREGTAKIS